MVRTIIALSAAGGLVACASHPVMPRHPIHGMWSWTRAVNHCTETYEYRPDGTTRVTSGDEIAESRYTISAEPDGSGFYRMEDETTKSNGKTDCAGSPTGTPVGDKATVFIFIRPSGQEMYVCREPNVRTCFGPLSRQP